MQTGELTYERERQECKQNDNERLEGLYARSVAQKKCRADDRAEDNGQSCRAFEHQRRARAEPCGHRPSPLISPFPKMQFENATGCQR